MPPRAQLRDAIAYPPLGMGAGEAARYLGISETLFAEMVADGRMPRPRRLNSRRVWDRDEIAARFRDLPRDTDENRIDAALSPPRLRAIEARG